MSTPTTTSILFGGMWIGMGILQIAFPNVHAIEDGRGISKYRFGSRGDAPWLGDRAFGAFYVFCGAVVILFDFERGTLPPYGLLKWGGLLFIAGGLFMLIAEPHVAEWQRRRQARRRAVSAGGFGGDVGELPPRRSTAARVSHAAFLLVFGISSLVLSRTI